MRILIFCDMEGVCGIQSWEHTGGSSPLYEEGRRLYTAEVNAAVRGALAGGAARVIAQDGHGGAYPGARAFMNWIPDQLERGGEYVRGFRWGAFVEPVQKGEIDAVALLGAHARAGTPDGVLCHTVSADGWYAVRVNGTEVGESEVLASIAGSFGVPVLCIAGDYAACRQLAEVVGSSVLQIPVKWGLGRYAARILAPGDACRLIEQGFRTAVADPSACPLPLRHAPPVTVTVELATPDRARSYADYAGVRLTGPRTVEATGSTFWEAWSCIWKDT